MKRRLWLLFAFLLPLSADIKETRVRVEGKDYMLLRVDIKVEERGTPVKIGQWLIVFHPHSAEGSQWRGDSRDIIDKFECYHDNCNVPDETVVKKALAK